MILRLLCLALALLALPAEGQRRGRREPPIVLPRVTCGGAAPEPTTFARAAAGALGRARAAEPARARALHDSALASARAGVAAAEGNPYHHFLLGQAAVALGGYAAADSALRRAVELCTELGVLAGETRTATHTALYRQGIDALALGDSGRAGAAWSGALQLQRSAPTALSLGTLLLARGDLGAAGALLREVVTTDSAADSTGTTARGLVALRHLGARHYQADRLDAALEILSLVRSVSPNDPVAAELLALTHYRRGEWQRMDSEAVLALHPLNENALFLQYHALAGLRDQARMAGDSLGARRRLVEMEQVRARAEALPLAISELMPGEAALRGTLTTPAGGARVPPGTTRTLEFVLFSGERALDPIKVVVTAPIAGGIARFTVDFPREEGIPLPITGYRYRLLP